MSYTDRFIPADDLITHLDTVVSGITDPLLKIKYTGFLSVSAVTVYELAIKDIFIEFAAKKNAVFGSFTAEYCSRMNGKIKRTDLEKDYIQRFGSRYQKRFNKKIDACEKASLLSSGVSVKSCYTNLITWRHQYAHEGILSTTATYDEVKRSYQQGKLIIQCLAETLVR